ncbi:hypothetical protein MMC22_010601 [Lobaria immixta]|nr:hypothetical protein [Lobaria immixta]
MQTKIFLCAALFSATSLVTAEPAPQPEAEVTTPPTAAQSTRAIKDLTSYYASVTAAPEWSSVSSVLATAFPNFDIDIGDIIDATTADDFTLLPTAVQSYIVSFNKNADSIISKDLSGAAPKPTGAVMAAGAAAAGLLGVVAML